MTQKEEKHELVVLVDSMLGTSFIPGNSHRAERFAYQGEQKGSTKETKDDT